MDKYDQAIEFLKGVEPGSYFDECAELMETLLARVHAIDRPDLSKTEMAERAKQSFGAEAWYRRNGQRRSSAMLEAEYPSAIRAAAGV
jgi:hypothetical protein